MSKSLLNKLLSLKILKSNMLKSTRPKIAAMVWFDTIIKINIKHGTILKWYDSFNSHQIQKLYCNNYSNYWNMDFERSYFGTNEPLTSWALLSSLFFPDQRWSEVHLYPSNFLQNPYFRKTEPIKNQDRSKFSMATATKLFFGPRA